MLAEIALGAIAIGLTAYLGYLLGYRKGASDMRSRLVKDNVVDFFTRRKVR